MKKSFQIKKMDNRGASLFIVLMSIIFITLLASTVMAVSLSNLVLKQMENSSKKAFYTAETAVDEIYSGLGDTALQSVSEAYMIQLGEIVTVDPITGQKLMVNNDQANKDMKKRFVEDYLKTLAPTATLNATGNYTTVDTEATGEVTDEIVNYLNNYLVGKVTNPSKLSVKSVGKFTATANDPEYCLVLGDVVINYESAQDYFTDITTDFLIEYPDLDVQFDNSNPLDYLSYSLIAQQNVGFGSFDVDNPANATKALANVTAGIYAGKYMNINNGSALTLGGVAQSVAHEGIRVVSSGTQSQLTVGQATLWAVGDLALEQYDNSSLGAMIVSGSDSTLYIEDDLQFDGDGSYASIGGKYFGYGSRENADANNSSFIMNGRFGTLTVNTTTLELLGRAYIDTYMVKDMADGKEKKESGYENGESVNLKTNQSIYLVADRYLQDGVSNPIGIGTLPAADANNNYPTLIDYDDLEGFFAYDLLNPTTPVILAKDDTRNLYYLYYNFTNAENKELYIKALTSASGTLNGTDYAGDASYIEVKELLERGIQRNFYDYGTGNYNGGVSITSASTNVLGTYYSELGASASGLNYTLQDGTLTKTEAINRSQSVRNSVVAQYGSMASTTLYQDIINIALVDAIGNTTDDTETVTVDPDGDGVSTTFELIATNKDGQYVNITSGNAGIILHNGTGTITLDENFNGIIISRGTIIVKTDDAGISVGTNAEEVKAALEASDHFYKYFKAFHIPANTGGFSIENIGYGDIVYVQNWRKFED